MIVKILRTSTYQEMEDYIKDYIEKGYKPQGGVSAVHSSPVAGNIDLYVMMVKE